MDSQSRLSLNRLPILASAGVCNLHMSEPVSQPRKAASVSHRTTKVRRPHCVEPASQSPLQHGHRVPETASPQREAHSSEKRIRAQRPAHSSIHTTLNAGGCPGGPFRKGPASLSSGIGIVFGKLFCVLQGLLLFLEGSLELVPVLSWFPPSPGRAGLCWKLPGRELLEMEWCHPVKSQIPATENNAVLKKSRNMGPSTAFPDTLKNTRVSPMYSSG